jgi:hypothetical protein
MDYQRIVEAVFHEDPAIPCTLIYDNGKTRVYQINIPDPLIVRVLKGDTSSYQFQAALLEEVAAQDNSAARILYWETKEIENQAYGV